MQAGDSGAQSERLELAREIAAQLLELGQAASDRLVRVSSQLER